MERWQAIGLIGLTGVGLSGACTNDPIPAVCPEVGVGELVITEIRGPQEGVDQYGEWLEIYNPSNLVVDLGGLEVRVSRLDGSRVESFLVRESVQIAGQSYAVLGRQNPAEELPPHVDYAYQNDFDADFFETGAITLSTCGENIDTVIYRGLPTSGTLALSADAALDASANDLEANWCVDDREDEDTINSGLRGTPQEENLSCTDTTDSE